MEKGLKINTGDAAPIRSTPYPANKVKQGVISNEIDKMLAKGIIYPFVGEWSSPVVMIPKPDGSWRFCVSYVKLNAVTQKDSYPLHRYDTLPEFFAGKKFFTVTDLTSGFWQCPLEEEDQAKTSFVCHRGQFAFRTLPFGLCNAPSAFQRLMDHTLGDMLYKSAFIFIDDVCTAAETFDQHLDDVDEMLTRFEKNNLKIKLSKCHFYHESVEFLGHNFTRHGVEPMKKNMTSIESFATPTSVKGVRSFLGVIGYYRDHIQNFAQVAHPLVQMLKKQVEFKTTWGPPQLAAFVKLKRLIADCPLLSYPDPNLPFFVSCDTSDFATGAVLCQEFPISSHVQFMRVKVDEDPRVRKNYEYGLYCEDSVFHPSYVLPFQLGDQLYYSVFHYVASRKAQMFDCKDVLNELVKLTPLGKNSSVYFKRELKRLNALLDVCLLDCPFYEDEGWEAVEAQEWYTSTLSKFYCQPSATRILLRYSNPLRCVTRTVRYLENSLREKIIRAVQSRLHTINDKEPLPDDRQIYERKPIAFYSATLSPAECKYDTRERELLGIIRSLEKFDFYIAGCVELDHRGKRSSSVDLSV